jgi:ribosomal-protein-alanine N-acetyltransferase
VDELCTRRLVLRRWRDEDREPFARLNADPAVMTHFPAPLTAAESDALVDRIEAGFERDGFGLWALQIRSTADFAGFTGLARPAFEAHFTPAVEVGWRLAREAWGQGYATEAARAALAVGFETAGAPEIVSFTAVENARSRAVMERLGMRHDPRDDFDHPLVADGHRLRRHVLYRLPAERWRRRFGEATPGAPTRRPCGDVTGG